MRKAEFVPDPYFTGSDGFEEVLDILEDATVGLLEYLQSEVEAFGYSWKKKLYNSLWFKKARE